MRLKDFVREIPDFPKPGVLFRDITPLLRNPAALHLAISKIAERIQDYEFELIAAPEARGFILGAALAYHLGIGLIPIRKPNRLPAQTIASSYQLEYGENQLFMHKDAIQPGQRVLIVDDILATGGTVKACCELVEQVGGEVSVCAFLIELAGLNGRQQLAKYPLETELVYK
ncbi:MAG: adenine phosphoribosyltransferase [Gammaproteobacteria bacterium]